MTYLDASALVSLFMFDAHSPIIRAHLRASKSAVGVSDFAAAEFASTVSRRVRTSDITWEQGGRLLTVLEGWIATGVQRIAIEPEDIRVADGFVRRFELGLRVPDAVHLAVCRRLAIALLSFDARQAAAATSLGIALQTMEPRSGG